MTWAAEANKEKKPLAGQQAAKHNGGHNSTVLNFTYWMKRANNFETKYTNETKEKKKLLGELSQKLDSLSTQLSAIESNDKTQNNNGMMIAICIICAMNVLLVLSLFPILILRTRKQEISYTPVLLEIGKLKTGLDKYNEINASKSLYPTTESITSGVAAKLEERFQTLRTTLNNSKIDFSPIIKTLEQIKNDLLAENKSLKANEDNIAKQKSDLAIALDSINETKKRCKQKEEELDKIIGDKEEAIRLEVQNCESRKYEAERAKFNEECENLRNRADGLAKRLDDVQEKNASLLAEKELAEKTGFEKGCISQIDKIEGLSKALGELEKKYEQAQVDTAHLQEQEQQKFELRLSRMKADTENEIKQNFEAKVNDLITTLTAKETIITQHEESLRQLSSEKSEIEKKSIAQEA